MQRLQIELILRLDGHETHVLPLYGFGNRLRITVVILQTAHDVKLELRWIGDASTSSMPAVAVVLGNLIFQTEVIKQRLAAHLLSHHRRCSSCMLA